MQTISLLLLTLIALAGGAYIVGCRRLSIRLLLATIGLALLVSLLHSISCEGRQVNEHALATTHHQRSCLVNRRLDSFSAPSGTAEGLPQYNPTSAIAEEARGENMITDATRIWTWFQAARQKLAPAKSPPGPDGPIMGYTEEGVPVPWPLPGKQAAGHSYIAAASGTGKSCAVAHGITQEFLANQTLPPEQRRALCVVDPKSDLADLTIKLCLLHAPEKADNVHYFDPLGRGMKLGISQLPAHGTPLEIRAMEIAYLVAEATSSVGTQKSLGAAGPKQISTIYHYLLAAMASEHESRNILWSLDCLQRRLEKTLARLTTSRRAREFLLADNVDESLRSSCALKLQTALATTDRVEAMTCADSAPDWQALLGPDQLGIFDFGAPMLANLRSFFANLIVRLCLSFLLNTRESPYPGHVAHVFVDEAPVLIPTLSDLANDILTLGRSKGISLCQISQAVSQLAKAADGTYLKTILTNVPDRYYSRMAMSDCLLLAKEIAPLPGSQQGLSELQRQYAALLGCLPDRQFLYMAPGGVRERFRTADIPMEKLDQVGRDKADVIEQIKNRYRLPENPPPRVTLAEVSGSSSRPKRRGHPGSRRSKWG